MSNKTEKILALASGFEKKAVEALVSEAKKKGDKKLDPKAKVRNRGTVCVPAESAKDKKDHFPINNEAQARNALARVNQFSKVPEWYSGSLQGLVSLVARKVHSKYPGIKVSKDAKTPGKKKASEYYDTLLNKFADGQVSQADQESSKILTQQRIQSINAVNTKQLTPAQVNEYVDGFMGQALTDFRGNQIDGGQYAEISRAAIAKKQEAQTAANTITIPTVTFVDKAKPTQPAQRRSRFPYINPIFQTMLGVNPDTALGPQTQAALDMYKKTIGQAGVSNELAFEALKNEPQYKTKSEIKYDDTNDRYLVTREQKTPDLPPNPY